MTFAATLRQYRQLLQQFLVRKSTIRRQIFTENLPCSICSAEQTMSPVGISIEKHLVLSRSSTSGKSPCKEETRPRSIFGKALVALTLASVLSLAAPSMAETINFKADLKASSEVPPNDSKGSGFCHRHV